MRKSQLKSVIEKIGKQKVKINVHFSNNTKIYKDCNTLM